MPDLWLLPIMSTSIWLNSHHLTKDHPWGKFLFNQGLQLYRSGCIVKCITVSSYAQDPMSSKMWSLPGYHSGFINFRVKDDQHQTWICTQGNCLQLYELEGCRNKKQTTAHNHPGLNVPPQSSSLPAYNLWFPYTQKSHSRLHCSTNQEPIAKLAHSSNYGPYRLTIIWTNMEQLPVSMSTIIHVLEQIRILCLREKKNQTDSRVQFHFTKQCYTHAPVWLFHFKFSISGLT